MSFPTPSRSPSRSGASSPFKRLKISSSIGPELSSQRSLSADPGLPAAATTTNPLSHSPSSLRQFSVAGAPYDEANPAVEIPDFPHRRIKRADEDGGRRRGDGGGGYVSGLTDADGALSDGEALAGTGQRGKKNHRKKGRALTGHNAVLLDAIYLDLEKGKIEAAARLFGQLVRQRERGVPIDIRRHNLWCLGAEILMREGERPVGGAVAAGGADPARTSARRSASAADRWGDTRNMPKVRAYYDSLIQRYPYDYKRPEDVSAVDFWVALLSCEVYDAHAEQVLALRRLADPDADEGGQEDEEEEEEEEQNDDARHAPGHAPPAETYEEGQSRRERAARRRTEDLRRRTLARMQGVAARMDELMRDPPYAKLNEYARIRGLLSLYVADLLVPAAAGVSQTDLYIARQRREDEQAHARDMFRRVLGNGGTLDRETMRFVDPDADASELRGEFPVYSSLPMR